MRQASQLPAHDERTWLLDRLLYTAKMPVTAADLLYDRVLPFYEALGVKVVRY